MANLSKPEVIERFHLAFLQVLPQHVPPANYAVKGGANLRLFLESVRRSEDIDFNFVGRAGWSLPERVERALRSPALATILAVHRLKLENVTASKTTKTTGRWKIGLLAPGTLVNSKVEFSMRKEDRPLLQMASVSSRIAAAAHMRPALANHYIPTAAVEQKIVALALRSETQARDIFDLDFLLTTFPGESEAAAASEDILSLARKRVFEVGFEEYRDLVVTYLDPAFVAIYNSQQEWERIALHVATWLDAMKGRAV